MRHVVGADGDDGDVWPVGFDRVDLVLQVRALGADHRNAPQNNGAAEPFGEPRGNDSRSRLLGSVDAEACGARVTEDDQVDARVA